MRAGWRSSWRSSARNSPDRRAASRSKASIGICLSSTSTLARSARDLVNSTPESTSKTATVLRTGTRPPDSSRSTSPRACQSPAKMSTRTHESRVTPVAEPPEFRVAGLLGRGLKFSHQTDATTHCRSILLAKDPSKPGERRATLRENTTDRVRKAPTPPLGEAEPFVRPLL